MGLFSNLKKTIKAAAVRPQADVKMDVQMRIEVNRDAPGMRIERVGSGADLDALVGALRTADADVAHDFHQCTKLEKRGMLAMRRNELYGWICWRFPEGSREALAYCMIHHAWWITGLVLQRDRKAEVKVATSSDTWKSVLDRFDVPPELLAYAVQAGALKDEAAAELFSAEVWRQLGLDGKMRLTP